MSAATIHQAPKGSPGGRAASDRIAFLTASIIRASAAATVEDLCVTVSRDAGRLACADGAAVVLWSDSRRPIAAALNGTRWGFPEVMDRAIEAVSTPGTGEAGDALTAAEAGCPLLELTGFRPTRARRVLATVRLAAPGGDQGAMAILGNDSASVPDETSLALLAALSAAAGGLAHHLLSRAPRTVASVGHERGVLEHDARAERRRIARELHDGLIQSLYGTGLAIRAQAERTDIPQRGREMMQTWVARIEQLVEEARAYVDELEEAGDAVAELGSGLDAIAEEAAAAGLDISTEVTATEHVRPAPDVRREVLRVAREAVSNAVRHAVAHRIIMRVEMDPASDSIRLTVEDDGIGFDPAMGLPLGHGLRNMTARALALGGDVDIVSRPGGGTSVRLRARLGGRSSRRSDTDA